MFAQGHLVRILIVIAKFHIENILPSGTVVVAMVAAGATTGAPPTPVAGPPALLSTAIATPAAFDDAFAFNIWTRLLAGMRPPLSPPQLSSACRTTESIRDAR